MDTPVRRSPSRAHDLCKHSHTTCRELCTSIEVFVYVGDIPHHTELKLQERGFESVCEHFYSSSRSNDWVVGKEQCCFSTLL